MPFTDLAERQLDAQQPNGFRESGEQGAAPEMIGTRAPGTRKKRSFDNDWAMLGHLISNICKHFIS
jgi:hypothetical protein